MDAESTLKPEVFRPIVVTLVPGLMALTPFVFVAEHFSPTLFEQFEKHQLLCVLALIATVIAAGHIIEDFGSRLEVLFWCFMATKADNDSWYRYLTTESKNQPAENYIQSIVMRMKFESSFGIACLIFAMGYFWLYYLNIVTYRAYWYGAIGLYALAGYLFYEFYSGINLLKTLREKF